MRSLTGYLISVYKYKMAEDIEEKGRLSNCPGQDMMRNSTISMTMQWNRFPSEFGFFQFALKDIKN